MSFSGLRILAPVPTPQIDNLRLASTHNCVPASVHTEVLVLSLDLLLRAVQFQFSLN